MTASPPTETVSTPVNNANYHYGSVPTAAFTCSPGGGGTLANGLAGCSASIDGGPAVASGTALPGTVGSHSMVVTATDTDGQHTSTTRHYTVTALPPTESVSTPVNNANYHYGSVPDAAFNCTAGAGGALKNALAGCSASIDGGASVASSTALAGTVGLHTVVVTATDTDGQHTSTTRHYTVSALPPTASVTTPVENASYTLGSVPHVAFTCTPGAGGALKDGLAGCSASIDGDPAVASGTALPGTVGPHTVVVTATDTDGQHTSTTRHYTVVQPPSITSLNTVSFKVGAYGSFSVTTTGYPTGASMHITSSALPAGLTLTDNQDGTATLSGTPSAGTGGVHAVTITANNGVAPAATQTLTITIDEAPNFTAGPVSITTTVGHSVNATYTATGYPVPTITLTGTLPKGLSFAGDAGSGAATITGVPAAGTGGVYHVSVAAGNGISPSTSVPVTITVDEPPTITSANHATFTALQANTFQVTTIGGYPSGPITFSTSGPLPSGVTLSSTGVLSGNPPVSASGYWHFTINASNGPTSSNQVFTLFVQAPKVPTGAMVAPSGLAATGLTASGECVSWTLTGYAPYAPVTLIAYPRLTAGPPINLGTFTANANGRLTANVCLPDTARGSYTLLAAGYASDGSIHYQEARTIVQP